jgi:uncharacterized protein (DUF2384 family)
MTFAIALTPVSPVDQGANNWMRRPAPHIAQTIPASVVRAMKGALRAIDHDIQQHGAASYESIEQVRAALALARLF